MIFIVVVVYWKNNKKKKSFISKPDSIRVLIFNSSM